ncbi:DUF1254 domain-containing protein [Streptomyces sp. NBC_01465]|uniref:DUF1254 domain-containing protein n=1 Tax=Streptomyces sp. NBC_01465 TaxID=2903878 RepID=UPI002E369E60|nr:DUF1254 domain-containing protein [Streptomyces sp. NBC_01465]
MADDLDGLAAEAWLFGYPLLLMDATRRVMTSGPQATPVNAFSHLREFPDASFTKVVSPNADTLYSIAWLDLRAEPMLISMADSGGRYWMLPLLSAWTDVIASPGSRTTGGGAGTFAVCGPGWDGSLPDGVERIDAPTALTWVIGRTNTAGPADYPAVHALQDRMRLEPLSRFDPTAPQPVSVPPLPDDIPGAAPVEYVEALSGEAFFTALGELLVDNPPTAADAPAMERFAALGLTTGQPWNPDALSPAARQAVLDAPAAGRAAVARAKAAQFADSPGGWSTLRGNGDFGTDYTRRAFVAQIGLGANLDADAIYPGARSDDQGRPLTGAYRYRIHFTADQLPPVDGFWSLTLYNERQAFADNPLNRYAIGDRDPLVFAADGSLTLHIQHDSPGPEQEANWLPAPADAFNLFFRLYWPRPSVVDGTWALPPLQRVD